MYDCSIISKTGAWAEDAWKNNDINDDANEWNGLHD